MSIYQYEEAFGCTDKTSKQMRQAIRRWNSLYYGEGTDENHDSCQRIAYSVVNQLVRGILGEYQVHTDEPFSRQVIDGLNRITRQTLDSALIGGSCYLKPCPTEAGFTFTLINRTNVLIFARDSAGQPTDVGTVERTTGNRHYYTLLERRRVDEKGYLTITNRLYRSSNAQSLGGQVPLHTHPAYQELAEEYRFSSPVGTVGLIEVKTPMLNCVDGSFDGVSVYAAAADLICNIDENEAQFKGEFSRGQSRIIASRDLLKDDGLGGKSLQEHLFVGLDEDPEQVGITVFSPVLRHESYLERKQEYLRNVESIIGLKRGMLSDANTDERTATEISASQGDYSLTIMDFQRMWGEAVTEAVRLCWILAGLYRITAPKTLPQIYVDWGNGVLYDQERIWADYCQMVDRGLIKPEIALGWRFRMPTDTREDILAIRQKLMPEQEQKQ